MHAVLNLSHVAQPCHLQGKYPLHAEDHDQDAEINVVSVTRPL